MQKKWVQLGLKYQLDTKRISNEEIQELTRRLRRGDETVEHPLILAHLRMGISIVIKNNSSVDEDELIGEMEFAVTKAVREARRGKLRDNNITAYITSYVHHYIQNLISKNKLFGTNPRTLRYWRNKGNERSRRELKRIDIRENLLMTDDNSNYPSYYIPQVEDDKSEMEIREILDKISSKPLEKRIIELRSSGYTMRDIEHITECSKSRICEILNELKEKYDEYIKRA